MLCVEEPCPVDGAVATSCIVLNGKLYGQESQNLEVHLRKAIDGGARNILLDCTALEQIDSASLTALVSGLKYLRAKRGNKLLCFAVNPVVARVLTLTKIDKYIPIVADRAAALKALCAAG
ncbi:MAG TPA: STAS domain-containing protein [bacterium]|nr:STAS domain-containing protein [bacterium]